MLDAAAIILAGGKNTRMGANKALLEIEHRQLISRIIDELAGDFPQIIIVANDPEQYRQFGVRVTPDIIPERGPLSGIHAGLSVSPYRLNFITACDMPFINGPLAAYMVSRTGDADALVPRIDDKWQPLFAIYARDCLPAIADCLARERCKVTAFYPAVRVKYIEEDIVRKFSDPDRVFYNINTPAELAQARIMAAIDRPGKKTEPQIKEVQAWRIKGGCQEEILDPVVIEAPLTIFLNERELVTLLCTPEHMDELAVGFLYSEGLLAGAKDLQSVQVDADKGLAWVIGNEKVLAGQTFLKRYITTGCGKGTSFYAFHDTGSRPVISDLQVPAENLLALMRRVQQGSELFARTGGVHSTALCSAGEVLVFRDDIGRHNAADKIIGRCFLDGVTLDDKVLISSGRISSEILLKTAKAGIPVLVSRSAPTALAIEIAEQVGVTVAGFARGDRLNIYTHPQRITD